jgi:hypothetical protein
MANETTTSSAPHLMRAEDVKKYVSLYNRPKKIARRFCWETKGTLAVASKFPSVEEITVPAGTKTEGANFTRVQLTTVETTATPGFVGMELVLTDEAVAASGAQGIMIKETTVQAAIEAMDQRMDRDIFAASTSATEFHSDVATDLDEEILYAAFAEFSALEPEAPRGVLCALAHASAARIRKLLNLSTATVRVGDDAGKGRIENAYIGLIGGVECWESGNVADESTGKSNVVTAIGEEASGLGLVVAQEVDVEINRGREGALNKTHSLVFSAVYAALVTRQDRILELRST